VCWSDVLESPAPVSREAYEQASYDAVENAAVHCTIREDPDSDPYDRFVDERLVTCLASNREGDPLVLRSCFHQHFGAPYNHRPGESRAGSPEQRLLRYSEWLRTMADGNRWDLQSHIEGY
jgi:hypothetical protein